MSVSGSLDKSVVQRYLRRQLKRMRYCYEKELVKQPTLSGTVVLELVIDAQGIVSKASATGMENEALQSCVAAAGKSIQFPKVTDGGTVIVRYPLRFQPE